MKVIITGATGMVGKGVLLACLGDGRVTEVLTLGRNVVGISHPKLTEVVHENLLQLAPVAERLSGYDACFFCLGISSVGVSKEEYRRITHDLTLHVAKVLLAGNPGMTFCYVSGTGTATAEKSSMDWANVKGRVENELLRMGFKRAFMFRPAMILPEGGVRSRSRMVNVLYAALGPLLRVLKPVLPGSITTTTILGRAMVRVACDGFARPVLEGKDITQVGS
jgi:uncharacterized protein YbjT (DUF2867 family)